MRRIVLMSVIALVLLSGAAIAAEEPLFDTESSSVLIETGIGYLKEDKYDDAIAKLEEAVSIAPDAEGYYYLGYAYYMKGKKDPESRRKAIESFDQAYDIDPNFSPARFKPSETIERTDEVGKTEQELLEMPAEEPAKERDLPADPSPGQNDVTRSKQQPGNSNRKEILPLRACARRI